MRIKNAVHVKTLVISMHAVVRVVNAKDAKQRCGLRGTRRSIAYSAEICSSPEYLDERGFIIDWQDVEKAVSDRFRSVDKFPSCELFAMEICELIASLVSGKCSRVTVNAGIEGLPATMKAEWVREDVVDD